MATSTSGNGHQMPLENTKDEFATVVIGIVAIMGLSAKNSILIIVFAKELMSSGKSIDEALHMAVKQRFRPIVMTSLAFVLGVAPLALNSGAGSGAQNLVGMTVVFGVLSATIFGLYLTPLFFMWINNLIHKFAKAPASIQ